MTDDEACAAFAKELDECHTDAEGLHATGDAFVAKILRQHGFPKLADAYDAERKDWWYS